MRSRFWEVCSCCFVLLLNAGAAPSIISPPQNIVVNNASDAAFTIVATNAAAYQWQFQGQSIAGATNDSLSLTNVNTNQAGTYTVVVTADNISTSASATLTIVPGTMVQFAVSGYPGGVTNYLTVQLFDHDKPATVQNFIHYITSGAYSNLFWSRCAPGFVLQGGDYAAQDRTNASFKPLSIYEDFTISLVITNPSLPFEIDNEFNVGPLIHNTFGTLAMAKESGQPDSANSAFFINLADNSTNLDNQNGGFTVFGRVLSGSNVLEYFNGLSAPTNGIYDGGAEPFTALPVNYKSPTSPGDSNLFFVDFNLITPPPIYTNPPTVSLTYPTSGATVTNADVVVRGTSAVADEAGLARVIVNIIDDFGYDNGAFGGDASGTTNWSFDAGNLPPGAYDLSVESQDGAGNLSSNREVSFTVPRFPFSAVANGPGKISPDNLDGTNIAIGKSFSITAVPSSGARFVSWTSGTTTFLNAKESFSMVNGLQLTANFVADTLPGGISFTEPLPNAKLTNPTVTVKGEVSSGSSVSVTCQFFTESGISLTGQLTTNGAGAWSLGPETFDPGVYILQAVARDSSGRSTVISEKFTILSPLTIVTNGPGTTSLAGTYQEPGTKTTITAKPAAGSLFYEWSDGNTLSINPTRTFANSAGLALSVTFVENALPGSLSFTYPTSQTITDNFSVMGNVSANVENPRITLQIFSNNVPTGSAIAATVTGTTWLAPISNLKQGHYTAVAILTDSAGRQSMASQSFTASYYPSVSGTYYGLFIPTDDNINSETSGRVAVTVSRTGTFSMLAGFPARTYNVPGSLGTAGNYEWEAEGFPLAGGGIGEIYAYFAVDLTGGSGEVTGEIESSGYLAYIRSYRAMTNLSAATVPAVGNYVFSLQTLTNEETGGPAYDGYATLAVGSTGQLKLSGVLADNTSFSEMVGVSQGGVWPVYAGLYGGRGLLMGWVTNQPSGGASGILYWIKPAAADTYYTSGLAILASMAGTNYVPPVSDTQYQIVFSGNTINPAVTNVVTVNNGQFVPPAGNADKLKVSLSSAGVVTGSFANSATGKTLPFTGAFTSPAQGGSGFVLDTGDQTGLMQITLLPP